MPQAADSPSVFHLLPPVDAAALAELRANVASAARSGVGHAIVDIDAAPVLDSALIACLVATLRDVRAAGGELSLAVGRPSLIETLSVTSLDKVFVIEPPGQQAMIVPPAPARSRGRQVRLATASLMAFALLTGLARSSAAQGLPSADVVVQRVVDANPSLRSYQARVHVALRLQSFPFLAPHLEGTTYFKRPNNYEVVFDRVPAYAKGFDRLYADIGDPIGWERRFSMAVIGERTVNGHSDVVIRMVQKVRGMIDHQDVAVDEAAWRIDEMDWHYYNGGVITMTQDFVREGSWNVLATQHVMIRIPYVRAVADARYDDYHTNVAIDDAVFTKRGK